MSAEKFAAMLFLMIPQVVHLIAERHSLSEDEAVRRFYDSRLYELLEDEQTKLWHYSPLMLFTMYDEEINTGEITFPEESA